MNIDAVLRSEFSSEVPSKRVGYVAKQRIFDLLRQAVPEAVKLPEIMVHVAGRAGVPGCGFGWSFRGVMDLDLHRLLWRTGQVDYPPLDFFSYASPENILAAYDKAIPRFEDIVTMIHNRADTERAIVAAAATSLAVADIIEAADRKARPGAFTVPMEKFMQQLTYGAVADSDTRAEADSFRGLLIATRTEAVRRNIAVL